MKGRRIRVKDMHKLLFRIMTGWARREQLYDRLYSLNWGETTTNNYGFAPADGQGPERFQMQLYAELLKLLGGPLEPSSLTNVLEISCGRGGGLAQLAQGLPAGVQVVGLDFSANAIAFCRHRHAAVANLSYLCGHALQLPFQDGSFDVVVSVEASHAYGNDPAFLREVRRVLRPRGRFLYADYRTRRKVPKLERLARAAGLDGELRDITSNVVSACEHDAERRREIIRSNLPWYYRWLVGARVERYSGLPGTATFERFRGGDRMYFLTCMTPREHNTTDHRYPLSA